ncbi:MAG: tol-pal system protein YbgF [Deltaproteobacteria bacterium]|jgi:tol-pal system protein YbgF|nr:tol-pal system protein YbgF [Deltaproteobacteria bacterium]
MPRSLFLIAITLLFLLPGCGNGVVAGGGNIRRELDALKMEVADLKDRSRASVGTGVPGSPGSAGSYGSDLRLEVDNLRTNLQRLTENVETASIGGTSLRQQLEYMSAQLDRLEKKAGLPPLSRDVVATSPPVVLTTPGVGSQLPGMVTPGAPGATTGAPVVPGDPNLPGPPPNYSPPVAAYPGTTNAPTVGAPTPPVVVKTTYDLGKDLFDQKRYPEAIERFKEYIATEPTGANVAGAQFYIGESLYFQNKFEDAILEYQTVVSGFPKSPLVSTALLKQGLSFQAINDKASAKLLYQKVVRDYPKSYSAGIARERLKTI